MWREQKGADYQWIDRQVADMYVTGGTGVGIHKYLGPIPQADTGDATKPSYTTQSEYNIQDILFLENRDRKYDPDIYVTRGIYQRSDNDFDLSQFGLFLQSGTVIMTFHYNDMIARLGRKIMSGDVIELFHLVDNDVDGVAAALKRFYVVGDCSWATEGFSPTWWPHLWRAKLNPLVDSQEYKDILKTITVPNSQGPQGTSVPVGGTPLEDIMSTYKKYINVNEAVVTQAEVEVPKSGYDTSKIWSPGTTELGIVATANLTGDDQVDTADSTITADSATYSPNVTQNPKGYLTGDGLAPNDLPVGAGISFPMAPHQGDYYLRLDYLPNRLFRWSGSRWVKMEDNVRTNLTAGDPNNTTQRNSFVNNSNTVTLSNGDVIPEKQGLSKALRPKADY